jgi:hypothetical protein
LVTLLSLIMSSLQVWVEQVWVARVGRSADRFHAARAGGCAM